MSPKFLVGTVGSDLLIKSDETCRDLVDEAKNYLLLPQERPLMQGPRTRPRKPIRCGEVLFAGKCKLHINLYIHWSFDQVEGKYVWS
jgi:kelch-like protein 20